MSDYVYIPSIDDEEPVDDYSGESKPANDQEILEELREIDEMYMKEASSIGATLVDSSDGSNKLQTTRLMATIPKDHSVISSTLGQDLVESEDLGHEKKSKENVSLGDMTIKQLYSKTSASLLAILTELFSLKWDSNFLKNLVEIFSKEERLLSTGILMVTLSIIFLALRKS